MACSLRQALTVGSSMWKYGVMAFAAAVGLAIASEMALVDARTPNDFPPDVLLMLALRLAGAAAIAPAMLPALFLMRRDPRTTRAASTRWLAAGAVVAALATVSLQGPEGFQLTAEENERVYQREF